MIAGHDLQAHRSVVNYAGRMIIVVTARSTDPEGQTWKTESRKIMWYLQSAKVVWETYQWCY